MRKTINKEELLFDVNDVISSKKRIILGNDLHIPYESNSESVDWNVESLLVALEIAEDAGFELYKIPHTIIAWKVTYYCRINGQTYEVTESQNKGYGDIEYEIKLV